MPLHSLLEQGRYTPDWVQDFYDQTAIWWGADSDTPAEDQARAAAIHRLGGPGSKRVLELGAGHGHTAAATARLGHHVTAVELSPRRAAQARALAETLPAAALSVLEGDFYSLAVPGRFDVVCYWDGFGVGTDADQRRLLRRIAEEWLAEGGCALIDVASTAWAARHAGEQQRLGALEGVPGSVEMLRRYHFDVLHSRWIDEWQPAAHPEHALAQTIRGYTPADFALLLEGSGLALARLEVEGQALDFASPQIATGGPLAGAYSFLAQLVAAG
jgi:SAM-dependent methyltransferase